MKNKLWNVLVGTALANAMALQSAEAAFVMTLDDIGDAAAPTVVYDGGLDDLSGVDGAITFSGSIGVFSVNVTTGVSKPLIGPARLDLNSIDISGAAGTLLLAVTDTDYDFATPAFTASYGGTTDGSINLSFRHDPNNTEFGGAEYAGGTFVASKRNDPFSGSVTGAVVSEDLYSMSIFAQINHGGGFQATSFIAGVTPAPVPVPGTALLFGSALTGLFLRRRRKSC